MNHPLSQLKKLTLMPKRSELQELVNRDRDRAIKSTREAGWTNATFIRRPLRPATWKDRILIFVAVFIVSVILTWAGYWYLFAESVRHHDDVAAAAFADPIQKGTLYIICLAGGVVGVIIYAVISIADPYGTVAAERREEKRQQDREEMLSELRKHKFPDGTEYERAIKRLAELENVQAQSQEKHVSDKEIRKS